MTRRKPLAGIYQLTTFLALVLLLLILFISAAYFFMIPAPEQAAGHGDKLTEVASRRSTWATKRPPSFRYVVDRNCYCEPAYVEPYIATEERGNRSAAFTIEIESASGEFISSPPDPMWIENLFDLIERSVHDAMVVEVEYDEDLGYPASILIRPDPAPPDSLFRVEVRDFEILEYR
jgi:hypothetical protein